MAFPFADKRLPRVTVIVPAFNAVDTIGRALASVFAQTYRHFEVIVVDDGSTDGTCAALEPWKHELTYVTQANGGPGRARNAGIECGRGSLVAFLDADDQWLPDKLERQVEYFDTFPGTGLLHTAAYVPRVGGSVPTLRCARPLSPPRWLFREIFTTDVEINTLTVMASREALESVGRFDERREVHVEDWDLWLRIAARYPVGYLPCPLAVRSPGGAMSGAAKKTFRGQLLVVEKAAPTYRSLCREHGLDPESGIRRTLHRSAMELGYRLLERNQLRQARAAFARALRQRAGSGRALAYCLATLLPARAIDTMRAAKRRQLAAAPGVRVVPPQPPARQRRASLAQDTVYRRARRRVADRLHTADDAVRALRGGPRRVLFEAASPLSFVVFRSVYNRLAADPRIEFHYTSTSRSWPAQAIFNSVGISERIIPPSRAAWMKFDACINTDFYEMTWLHRRTVRLHLFHGVAGKYGIDAPVHVAPDIAAFDRLLFPNADRMNRYLAAGLVDERAALLVGYPKADSLVDGSLTQEEMAQRLRLRRSATTVIYAPTWSPDSSLNVMGEEVVQRLVLAGFNVLVKLHDRSYDLTRRASGGVDWMTRLSVYDGDDRVRIIRDPDAAPYLMAADALVTDHSSVGFEYALLDRPIVVLDAPKLAVRARVNPEKIAMLRAAAELVAQPADLERAVLAQLESPLMHAHARRRLADEMFYRPGTAADRATAVVYEALELEAPAAAADVPSTRPALAVPGRKAS